MMVDDTCPEAGGVCDGDGEVPGGGVTVIVEVVPGDDWDAVGDVGMS